MKKSLIVLCLLLITGLSVQAQELKSERQLVRQGGKYLIKEYGQEYKVNEKVLLVKFRPQINKSQMPIKILQSTKSGVLQISVPDSINVSKYKALLDDTGDFLYVEYSAYGKYELSPNDSGIGYQWHLSKILAQYAWNITTGSPNVKIAVMDTGTDNGHYDLNYGNDNYSNIDYVNGYNFEYNANYVTPTYFHGTFVSGIIGAKTNNSLGIAGVAGGNNSPGAKIIPLCVGTSMVDPYYVVQAIEYAIEKGVRVINMSFGISYNQAVSDAIDDAVGQGITVVCASGNGNSSSLPFPANNANTISVGATNANDQRSSYSNYGIGLDLVAPGDNIYSTTLNNSYASHSGTSFAAPQVAGVAGLMLSVNSSLTPADIKCILKASCIKLSGYTFYDNINTEVGAGLLNAYAAVSLAQYYQDCLHCTLSGSSTLCYGTSSNYTINGVPSNATVSWSFNKSYGNNAPTPQVGSSDRVCTISNYMSSSFGGELRAEVKLMGYTLKTYTKRIYGESNNFTGHYWDGNTYMDVLWGDDNWVTPGNTITVTSDELWNNVAKITRSSAPNNYTTLFVNGNSVHFTMPNLSSGESLTLWITGGCQNHSFIFYANNSALMSNTTSLSVASIGNNKYVIKVDDSSNDTIPMKGTNCQKERGWTFRVYSIGSLLPMMQYNVSESSYVLDTSAWKKGIYIIRAVVNEKAYSAKLIKE